MPTPGQELSSIDFASMIGAPLRAAIEAEASAAMTTVNFIKEVGFKRLPAEQDPDNALTGEPIYVTFQYQKEKKAHQPAVPATIALAVTNGGSGYASAPTVTISAPPIGGAQATATAAIDSNGVVTSVTLTDPGAGYTSAPSVTVAAPAATGTNATVTATLVPAVAAAPAEFETMQLSAPILACVRTPSLQITKFTLDFNAKIDSIEYQRIDTSLKVDASLEVRANWKVASAKLNVSTSYQRNTQEGTSVSRAYSLAIHIEASGNNDLPEGLRKLLDILESTIHSQPVLPAQ